MSEDHTKKEAVVVRVNSASDKKLLPFKNQSFEKLRDECLKSRKLFEDPLFEPNGKSMFYTQSVPSGTTWKRPGEICKAPKFIESTANANDLDQGYLGNCWFVAACASVVLNKELFENICPQNQAISGSNYAGIFHFRFWYYGQWVDIVVDDRLPVYSDNRLIFCSNKQEPNEFWAALLEKAYAKLYGCYENLDGGSIAEALIDMSGGIEESFDIKNMQNTKQKDEIWDVLVKSRQHKSMIGTSIAPNPRIKEAKLSNGLVMGHAYTVTKIALLEINRRDVRLIRLRNPWGNAVEWKGSWSDNSYEWYSVSQDVKNILEYRKLEDGEFWMSFDDYYRNFESLQFVELTPDALSGELLKKQDPKKAAKLTWKLTAYHDEWVPGKTSGGSGKGNEALFWTNPQFLITLTDVDPIDNENMATIIISLLQKNTREKRMKNKGQPAEEFLQFRLYRILNDKDAEDAKKNSKRLYASQMERVGVSGPYTNLREVTKRFRVAPGNYVIIPSCYDANISGQFLLRMYTEQSVHSKDCSVLHDCKHDLDEKDIFFNEPTEEKFGNWFNLLGSSNSSSNQNNNDAKDHDSNTQLNRAVLQKSTITKSNTSLSSMHYCYSIYDCKAHTKECCENIYEKVDAKRRI